MTSIEVTLRITSDEEIQIEEITLGDIANYIDESFNDEDINIRLLHVEFIWDWDEVEGAQDCGDIETIEYYLAIFEKLEPWMQNSLNSNGNVDEMIRWLVENNEKLQKDGAILNTVKAKGDGVVRR